MKHIACDRQGTETLLVSLTLADRIYIVSTGITAAVAQCVPSRPGRSPSLRDQPAFMRLISAITAHYARCQYIKREVISSVRWGQDAKMIQWLNNGGIDCTWICMVLWKNRAVIPR